MDPIYLDHNGSAPLAPEVIEVMRPLLQSCTGNPASAHVFGRKAREVIERSRASVARLLGAKDDEIVFTSGGTESNNMAIKGLAETRRSGHIVTLPIEHGAVLGPCRYLERRGFSLTIVGVDSEGVASADEVEAAFTPETFLVSVMLANNEVGSFQPVRRIAAAARRRGILVHCDAAQVVGKEPVKVDELGVDLLTVAGHKLNGPKGVGALYVRRGVTLEPLHHGAGHEGGRRSGTQDTLEIAGLGAAADRFERHSSEIPARYLALRRCFEQKLFAKIPRAELNGPRECRLVNTVNVAFPGVTSGALLAACPGIAASPGASCHKDHTHVSHVLTAMGLPRERIDSSIRFSLGFGTTEGDLDRAVDELSAAYGRLSAAR